MKKNPAQTEKTRESLKCAFWTLFARESIDTITIKKITDLAGFNRGTFYVYFKDVYDMREQVEQEIIDAFIESSGILPTITNHEEEWTEHLMVFISFYDRFEKQLSILLGKQGNPNFTHKFKEAIKKRFRDGFGTGQETDEYILEYISSAQVGLVSYWFRQRGNKSLVDMVTLTRDILFNGPLTLLLKEKRMDENLPV